MILGLDASSSVIGYTLLDSEDSKLIEIGYVNISNVGDLIQKAEFVENFFTDLLKNKKITSIYIEDISKKFSPGFSSAQIITLLAKFNGMVSYIMYKITNIMPNYIMSTSARKTAYNMSFKRGIDIKVQVMEQMLKREKLFFLKKKSGKLVGEAFDAADSYTLALAGFKIEQQLFRENTSLK